uniref:Uncharacterized protein n=1 Tax=Trichogramma kaykai TaxID=54128 RepID=A0ABD2XK36_9HYME
MRASLRKEQQQRYVRRKEKSSRATKIHAATQRAPSRARTREYNITPRGIYVTMLHYIYTHAYTQIRTKRGIFPGQRRIACLGPLRTSSAAGWHVSSLCFGLQQ